MLVKWNRLLIGSMVPSIPLYDGGTAKRNICFYYLGFWLDARLGGPWGRLSRAMGIVR
jgi:hypothetical protein